LPGTVRAAGATGRLTLRADSGFYTRSVVAACARAEVNFSITARTSPKLKGRDRRHRRDRLDRDSVLVSDPGAVHRRRRGDPVHDLRG
jgi:hypothetical protein